MQERRIPTLELMREEVLPLNPLEDPQQCEVTMLREDKNKKWKEEFRDLNHRKEGKKSQ